MSTLERLAASTLLALGLVPAAHAGDELNLRWDNCFGDGGVYNKTFACDTNSGSETLVGSFRLAATTDEVNGFDIRVDLTALGPTLPAWWYFGPGAAAQARPLARSSPGRQPRPPASTRGPAMQWAASAKSCKGGTLLAQ